MMKLPSVCIDCASFEPRAISNAKPNKGFPGIILKNLKYSGPLPSFGHKYVNTQDLLRLLLTSLSLL